MAAWEVRPGDMLDRPVAAAADKQDVRDRVFVTDGRAKDWAHRPPVELFNRATKKRRRERANAMPFMAGAFVLDAKARRDRRLAGLDVVPLRAAVRDYGKIKLFDTDSGPKD